jgi:hypothetical protein
MRGNPIVFLDERSNVKVVTLLKKLYRQDRDQTVCSKIMQVGIMRGRTLLFFRIKGEGHCITK